MAVTLPASGYMSNSLRTKGEMGISFEQLRDGIDTVDTNTDTNTTNLTTLQTQVDGISGNSAATELSPGIAELASSVEVQTGTDTERIVTPAGLSSRSATETRTGIAELATNTEVQTGTDTERIVTPASLRACTATDSRQGVIELATNAEVQTGTDTSRAVTPDGLQSNIADGSETRLGTSDTLLVSPLGLTSFVKTDSNTTKISTNTNAELGIHNIAVGDGALFSVANGSATNNVALGFSALESCTVGAYNVCVGNGAGLDITTGLYNVLLGYTSGFNIINGFGNTCVGNASGTLITSGDYNTCVGVDAGDSITTEDNATCIGYNSDVTGSNQVQLGSATTTTYAYGAVQDRSDKRDKTKIEKSKLGLEFIEALTPRKYQWDYREDYREDNKEKLSDIIKDDSQVRTRPHYGLIAQEVKQVMDDMNIDFGGFQDHSINGGDDVLSLGYSEFISPMIKAIQELSQKVKDLESQLSSK